MSSDLCLLGALLRCAGPLPRFRCAEAGPAVTVPMSRGFASRLSPSTVSAFSARAVVGAFFLSVMLRYFIIPSHWTGSPQNSLFATHPVTEGSSPGESRAMNY